jgi:DNA primase
VRTPEGKVKAVNFLLPHVQRVPSRIVRDELATDIAQRLQIDSAVLRQEMKHVATERKAAKVNAAPESPITEAERVLIRALAGSPELGRTPVSGREGMDQEFDPALQAHFALKHDSLHHGLRTEVLIETLLRTVEDGTDSMSANLSEDDKRVLAECLMKEGEELTPELLEHSVDTLRERALLRERKELTIAISRAEQSSDRDRLRELQNRFITLDQTIKQLVRK